MGTSVDSKKISFFNLAVVFALCLGSLSYGYTFSIVSTTLGQPGFYSYFELAADETEPNYAYTKRIQGAINGLFCAGGLFGSLFVGWSCDALGRKKSLWVASPLGMLGGALQAGSAHIAMFLIGRIISGFAVGILVMLIPLFQTEIAPPSTRGFLVSQHGVILVAGYSLAAWTGFACYFSKNLAFSWRFPLAEQCLWPLLMFILTPFIPESPRWLIMKGRIDEAWAVTAKLHGTSKEASSASEADHFAREEFYQMRMQVTQDQNQAASETVWTLFSKPSYRKRMICAFFVMFGAEATGILVVYNYSVLLYQGLGFDNKISLLLAALYVTVACAGNYICSLLIDRVGRVRLLLIGLGGCLASLVCEAAMVAKYSGTGNEAGLRAGVFFLFLYITFYGCCIDATTYVYCAEIFPTHIRSRGVAWSLCILFLSALVFLEAAPTAFATIGWKYYILFIVLTIIDITVIYFVFPETMGLSLEEIGAKFGDEVVVRLTDLTQEQREALDRQIFTSKTEVEVAHVEREKGESPSISG